MSGSEPSRRAVLGAGPRSGAPAPRILAAQTLWDPPPPQAPAKTGFVRLPDVSLSYWDTGGRGEPIVLLHPITGSNAIWLHQQPVLVRAGYRVIAFSRRGYGQSEPGPAGHPGTGAGDLHGVVEALSLERFHLLGSAGGGFIAPEYALAHPERVLSLIVACSTGGMGEAAHKAETARLAPEAFARMPAAFRELGPAYRAANPEGAAEWARLERETAAGQAVPQPRPSLSWQQIESLRTRTLVLGGSADLYMPPPRLAEYAGRLPNAVLAVILQAGHSAYWEQPIAFNRAVVDFLKRRR